MKKVFISLSFFVLLMVNLSAKAQQITITLKPGWNWISYTQPDTLDLATALENFTPIQGDRIKSRNSSASFGNGRWTGSLHQFTPGWGYKYYSNRTEDVSFVFAQASSSTVVTATPTDITTTSAVVGGTVTVPDGGHVFLRGVCWGTEPAPDIDGNHIIGDNVAGSQSFTLTGLTPNTVYYVRAYAVTDCGLAYGEEQSFTSGPLPSYTVTISFNPIDGGTATGDGIYEEGQSCTVSAAANDGYAFTNWTENGIVVSISPTYSFTVDSDRTLMANFIPGDHAYVDLGLPSGLLWATCNVGAENPEDYGDYFAWGETTPKESYTWENYIYMMLGASSWDPKLIKYCINSDDGYNGFTDNLLTLLPEDDAATANWGNDWRTPTRTECLELINNTTHSWIALNGVNGCLFTASNGNSIFIPAAGFYDSFSGDLYDIGNIVVSWSSSLVEDYHSTEVWVLISRDGSNYPRMGDGGSRPHGITVRAVRSSAAPTGAINGKFTVNSNGDQVYFSQGNLQYIGSASTPYWRFAENQWDYLGTTTSQNSSNQNVDRDLFGWATSGYDHGSVCYQPWSTSKTDSDYYAYGDEDYNLYDGTGQADWGYNAISNGGNQQNRWRTLTLSEWGYVFKWRATPSGIRYAKAVLNGVNGVVLLPDDWNTSVYSLSNTNNSGANFSTNIITSSQWSALEQNGAVFLPAAGNRNGTSVYNAGSSGLYWSATSRDDCDCWYFEFGSSYLDTDYDWRYYGGSVRLVCPVEQ